MLMDFFGGVPLVTSTKVEATARVPRDSIFRFIESELNATRTVLPATRPAGEAGRVTTRRGERDPREPVPERAGLHRHGHAPLACTKGTARWQDAITAADRVINSGQYALAADWRKNFSPDNHDSTENIFFVASTDAQPGLGLSLPMRTLHYNQLTVQGGPWNGFATIAETYNAFDPADARRNIFLVGQQFSFETGQPVKDRAGNPLVFTVNIGERDAGGRERGSAVQQVPAAARRAERRLAPERLPVLPPRRDVPDQGRGAERARADGGGDRAGQHRSRAAFTPPKPLGRRCRRPQARDGDPQRAAVRARRRGQAPART